MYNIHEKWNKLVSQNKATTTFTWVSSGVWKRKCKAFLVSKGRIFSLSWSYRAVCKMNDFISVFKFVYFLCKRREKNYWHGNRADSESAKEHPKTSALQENCCDNSSWKKKKKILQNRTPLLETNGRANLTCLTFLSLCFTAGNFQF